MWRPLPRGPGTLLAWLLRRAAPPVAARRPYFLRARWLRAGAHRAGIARPPHGRDLHDVAALRRLDHLVAAQVDRHVVDRARIAGVVGPEDQVPGLQVGLGHLRQVAELGAAVARD